MAMQLRDETIEEIKRLNMLFESDACIGTKPRVALLLRLANAFNLPPPPHPSQLMTRCWNREG